jgi:hypothetical protein
LSAPTRTDRRLRDLSCHEKLRFLIGQGESQTL